MLFAGSGGAHAESFAEGAVIVLTVLLLEAVLSFDNAAILAAMVRKLPKSMRKKALLYGLVGAYTLRIAAIFAAAFLIKYPIFKAIGGAYLIFLFIKHFIQLIRHRSGHEHHVGDPNKSILVRMGIPVFVATIIQIELIDLVFALDQVVVAVGFTQDIWLIVIASLLGILFLRVAATYMAQVMDWLPTLEHMAYMAVGFVGFKLVLETSTVMAWFGLKVLHIGQGISIGVTLALFVVPVLIKLIFKYPKSQPGSHEIPEH